MSRHKTLIKNTFILLMGKIFTQFLSFFMLPIYTRMLPAADYGAVDLVLTYISLFIPVITIEQSMATFRFLVDARNNKVEQSKIIQTSFRSIATRLVLFSVAYLLVTLFLRFEYMYLILPVGIVVSFSQFLLQVARGFGDNLKYTIASIVAGVVTILSNLLLICVLHFGAESILISMGVANLCCFIYLFFALRLPHYLNFGRHKSEKKLRKKMLKYSWPLVPNGISWWLINASDRTIISIFLGTAENGIYAVANKFPSIVSSFIGVFSLSWSESASVHINDNDRDKFFSDVAKNSLRVFSSLGVLVIAAMPFVFDVIVGQEYREAYNYIPIAVLAVLLNSMVLVYSAIYVAKKETKKVASTSMASALINIIVDLVLIKFVGLYAAVISTAVAYFVMLVYRHFDVKKYVNIRYLPPEIALVVTVFVIVSVMYYADGLGWHIAGGILALIYAAVLNKGMIRGVLKGLVVRKRQKARR